MRASKTPQKRGFLKRVTLCGWFHVTLWWSSSWKHHVKSHRLNGHTCFRHAQDSYQQVLQYQTVAPSHKYDKWFRSVLTNTKWVFLFYSRWCWLYSSVFPNGCTETWLWVWSSSLSHKIRSHLGPGEQLLHVPFLSTHHLSQVLFCLSVFWKSLVVHWLWRDSFHSRLHQTLSKSQQCLSTSYSGVHQL